jgi:hypothetical protein
VNSVEFPKPCGFCGGKKAFTKMISDHVYRGSGLQDQYDIKEPKLELAEEESMFEAFMVHCRTFWRGVKFAATWHTFFLASATCLAIFVCSKGVLDFSFATNMSIVAVGTVFPLVFSVQAAFARREKALACLSKLRASGVTIYLMFLTWEKAKTGKWAAEADKMLQKLLDDIEWYMRSPYRVEETANVVYDGFSSFSVLMNEFGPEAGFAKGGEGGMSRMQLYFRLMMQQFEDLRAIRDSETPVGLRLFCFALIHITPIILAPYWNHFCEKQTEFEMPSTYGCEAGPWPLPCRRYDVRSQFAALKQTRTHIYTST